MAFTKGYALVIGVGSYGPNPPLGSSSSEKRPRDVPITVADAKAVDAILKDPNYCGYPADHVMLLHDQDATSERILQDLDRLSDVVGPEDTVFLFYAGHGEYDTDQHSCLTANDTRLNLENKVIASSGMREDDLLRRIKKIRAERALLVFNSCHSVALSPDTLGTSDGPTMEGGQTLPEELAAALLGTGQGRVMIAACRQQEKSYFRRSDTRTFFGAALADGLEGKGVPNRHGYIGVFDLYEHLYTTVRSRAKQFLDVVQQPELTISKGVGMMAVAFHRGATPPSPLSDTDLPGSLGSTGVVREVEPIESSRLFEAILSGQLKLGDSISIGKMSNSTGVAIGPGATSTVRTINTGGGAYAERNIDKRSGTFVGGNQFNLSGNFDGAMLNIESTLTAVSQSIVAAPRGDTATKTELQQLIDQLNNILHQSPANKSVEIEAVVETAKQAVAQATRATPNKALVQINAEMLKQAAQSLKDVLPEVPSIATRIAVLLSSLIV